MPRLEGPDRPPPEPEPIAEPGPIAEPEVEAVEQAFVDSYVRLLEVSLLWLGPEPERPQTSGDRAIIGAVGATIANLESLHRMQDQLGMAARTEEIRKRLFQSVLGKMKAMQF
jgi:hypothetical protein